MSRQKSEHRSQTKCYQLRNLAFVICDLTSFSGVSDSCPPCSDFCSEATS